MVDLEKRAKAWDTYAGEPRVFTIGDAFNFAYEAGVRDGAASVDRVAVVREAVNEVNKRLDAIEKHRTIRLADYDKAMDAVLAEMEANNADS